MRHRESRLRAQELCRGAHPKGKLARTSEKITNSNAIRPSVKRFDAPRPGAADRKRCAGHRPGLETTRNHSFRPGRYSFTPLLSYLSPVLQHLRRFRFPATQAPALSGKGRPPDLSPGLGQSDNHAQALAPARRINRHGTPVRTKMFGVITGDVKPLRPRPVPGHGI